MLEIPQTESLIKKHALLFIAVLLCIGLSALSLFSWKNLQSEQPQDAVFASTEKGDVKRKILGQGKLKARDNNTIISEVEGIVVKVIQHPGTKVTKGQALVQLKNPDLIRIKEKSSLKLLEATAEHSSTMAELEAKHVALVNEVRIAESDIEYAQQEIETLTSLLDSGGVAKLDHVRATNRFKKSQFQLSLAKSNLEIFKKTRTALEQASSYKLLAAEKELALAEFDLKQLTIKAGTEGLLGSYGEHVEIGKMLPRGEVLGQISNLESLYLDFYVSANDAAEISEDMDVFIDIRGNMATGSVIRVHPNVENNLVKVEASITGELPAIARENIEVLVEVVVEQAVDTLRVKTPNNITFKDKEQTAFLIKDGKLFKQKIIVGVIGQEYMQVLKGLDNGDQIIINPESLSHEDI